MSTEEDTNDDCLSATGGSGAENNVEDAIEENSNFKDTTPNFIDN